MLFQSDTMHGRVPMLIAGFTISSLGEHVYCVVPVSTTTCTWFNLIYIHVSAVTLKNLHIVVAHSRGGRAWCERAWGSSYVCLCTSATVLLSGLAPAIMPVAATVLLLLAEAVATSWSCSVEPQPACANSWVIYNHRFKLIYIIHLLQVVPFVLISTL